ncbi:MAG: hypothetical protein ACKOC1_10415 [Hyphomicrobiales bacterium]
MQHLCLLIALTLTLVPLAARHGVARPATQDLILPTNEGYGMDECLAAGGTCGEMVADAWCKANGLAKSIAYGPIDPAEMTASISTARIARTAPAAYRITCEAPQP